MERVGVILLHQGEPTSGAEAKEFLRRYYADPRAYFVPVWSEVQRWVAPLIAGRKADAARKALAEIGGHSPLPQAVESLARSLEQHLNGTNAGTAAARFRVLHAFRYCAPGAKEQWESLSREGISRVVGVSLYPQFGRTLVGSSVAELDLQAEGARLSVVDRYAEHPAYLEAVRETIRSGLSRFDADLRERVGVLFCALGISDEQRAEDEHYPSSLAATAEQVMVEFGNPHRLGYLGKDALSPSAEQLMRASASENFPGVLLVPLGTAVEQTDTLLWLETRLRTLGNQLGIARVERAVPLSSTGALNDVLAQAIHQHLERQAALQLGL